MVSVPDNIRPYVDVLGADLAVKFLLAFGGGPIYLSNNPLPDSALSICIGQDQVKALAKAIGPGHISRVPNGKPWLAAQLLLKGWSVVAIARHLHVADTTVRRWFEAGKPSSQLQLF